MAKEDQAVKEKQVQQKNTSQEETKKQAQSVEFSEVVDTGATSAGGNIDILLDMDVPITVTIGRTEIPIQRLLQIGPNSVLKLDKSIDEPADLYLKDTKFATGSVVVVDGRFAVKIEQILGLGDSAAKSADV